MCSSDLENMSYTFILHCVEFLVVCVCYLSHTPCVCLTWCLTWYQSGWLLALLQIEWAICVYALCISAKFLTILQHLETFRSSVLLPFRSVLKRSSIQNPWQRSEIDFEEEQQWCWRSASEGFLNSDFFSAFSAFNFALESCWKYCSKWGFEEKSWFFK